MELQELSSLLLECMRTDDVVGARRLLDGIDEQDKKLIVGEGVNFEAPLCVAVMRGNVSMVEFLVKECHVDSRELLKVWINIGADMDGNTDAVKYLMMHEAVVRKSNNNSDDTSLMNAVQWTEELCQILINNGADVNAQNASGNTALHLAIIDNIIYLENVDIVKLLIDHGSNPYIENKDGDDAFRTASLEGKETILKILLRKFDPPVRRWIESYELLGAYFVHGDPPLRRWMDTYNHDLFSAAVHIRPPDIEAALDYWKKAVELRRNSQYDVIAVQPNPVYGFTKDVNTVEELQTLFQNSDIVCRYALMISERILGPYHHQIHPRMMLCGARLKSDREKLRHRINILWYAIQLNHARVEQMTIRELRMRFLCPLYHLCFAFCKATRAFNNFEIEFEEVFEVLQKVTSKMDDATGIILSQEFQKNRHSQLTFMKIVLHLVKLVTELDKNEDQNLRFNKVIYRLVRCQPKTRMGHTFLHLSVMQSTSEIDGEFFSQFPSIAVLELLMECGANVNAIDNEYNTALHLCLDTYQNPEMNQYHDLVKKIRVLLLKNKAHVDMIRISGNRTAAEVLTSSLIEMNIQHFDSLKCLAATAVVKYRIPYVGHISTSLEEFVQMHGT